MITSKKVAEVKTNKLKTTKKKISCSSQNFFINFLLSLGKENIYILFGCFVVYLCLLKFGIVFLL